VSLIPRPRPANLLALALVALAGAASRGDEEKWVGTWAASPQLTEPANMPPEPGLADATLRQIVHVSLGGKRLRVRFSNAFGAKPLKILSTHLATSAGGSAINSERAKPLTFGGRSSVTIPPGAPMISDPVDFDLASRDPRRPSRLSAAVDSGDHLHPGPEGHRIAAEAVDLKLFRK
jgi:hypothetical protein